MKRKTFLKTTTALAAGGLFSPLSSCNQPNINMRKNWAGNYQYKAENLHQPHTVEEVQALVKKPGKHKALGSRHCFNDIADTPLDQISTEHLNKISAIDQQANTVTVEAGARYGQFAPQLHQQGYALHNLASLPHISVAGACATATHGSGVKNGNLATAVAAIQFVNAGGEIINLKRGDENFNGAVVNLGAMGILTKLTLDVEKTYEVRQNIYQDLPLPSLQNHFEEILSAGYSVSLFTDWQNKNISQVWIKQRVNNNTKNSGADFFGDPYPCPLAHLNVLSRSCRWCTFTSPRFYCVCLAGRAAGDQVALAASNSPAGSGLGFLCGTHPQHLPTDCS